MEETPKNNSEEKIFANRITDLVEQCLRDQQPRWTDFLDPAEREQAQAILGWSAGLRFNSFGGYLKSERRRLVMYPDYYIAETIQPALACLEISTNSQTEMKHSDYLGALMSLGIKREKVGDLLVVDSGCQLIILPELVDFIKLNLTRVGNQKTDVKEIDPEQLSPPNLREKEIRTTVASLRLDAIAALGFGESRTKMAREIKSARVKVNWKTESNPDRPVNPGDIISIRGRGRVIFRDLTGRSKKNRLGIVLVRYL
jgi:RNA-binding protein YlmH